MNDYIPNQHASNLLLVASACNTLGDSKSSNATDLSILKMLEKFGANIQNLREKYLPENFTRFQFTSKRKKMSTILENVLDTETGYQKRVVVKGGADLIIELCTHFIDQNGERVQITP